MTDPLVAEVVRSGIVESVHVGDMAAVDERGALLASAGDPLVHASFRSSAKPIQAGLCLEAGWQPASTEHLAIACASHNGEAVHVSAVEGILATAGLDAGALRCPPDLPNPAVPEAVEAAAGRRDPRYHNCSGKHAAMLAACVARRWPVESYPDPAHPLQQAIHEALESLTGALLDPAVDGCGVVTYAAPLAAVARAFGAIVRDDPFTRAADAMRAHPFLVAGSARLDTLLMETLPGIVSKVGAEGLACAVVDGIAIAVKARDGAPRARGPFLLESLRRLGLVTDLPAELAPVARPPVLGGGRPVGEVRIRS